MPPRQSSRISQNGDQVMADGLSSDAVVLVMGPTGAGKSTFLRNVLHGLGYKNDLPECSDGLESCTKNLGTYVVERDQLHPGHPIHKLIQGRLVLVDTPGFDDTNVSDSEILRRISVWLTSSYESDMKVAGIIYMFPIYPNRITRNDRANLDVFRQLCGEGALQKVNMTTTKWSLLPRDKPKIGVDRENQLKSNFWSVLLASGSKISRLESEDEGPAMNLLGTVLSTYAKLPQDEKDRLDEFGLELQHEIITSMKSVPATKAGKELKRKLKALLEEHKKASGDPLTRQEKLRNIATQLQSLKIPFGERMRLWFKRTT